MNKLGFMFVASIVMFTSIASPVARAENRSGKDVAFFENKIRPVLIEHCYECHAVDAKEVGGKLLLDSRQGVRSGGESGPALVAGKPEESLIVHALRYHDLEMPPQHPLPQQIVNDFVVWIRRGAADPRVGKTAAGVSDPRASGEAINWESESLWSFRPRLDPPLPEIADRDWPLDPLDKFVLARIEAAKQIPTRAAPASILIRRLHHDLIGLPPTADQVQAFVDDHRRAGVKAVERLVDSLISSPHFGERWGRHWLDVARYGESNGDDGLGRNASFPHAWRYRDYVIESFNSDLPYDQFLTEQIAGDLLPAETAEQRNRQLVATGFLAIGSKPAKAMNNNFAMDVVDDQINVVSTAVMGLSVACARCHDHKHDPIATRDYYAFAGIFASTQSLYGLAANEPLTAPPTPLHQLTSVWHKDSGQATEPGVTPAFSPTYSAAIEQLDPALHAKLDTQPENLTVDSAIGFSPEEFAQVKSTALHGQLSVSFRSYSYAFWFKNDINNSERPITAYLFSRAKLGDKELPGDHLGIGGKHDKSVTGKLFVFNGNQGKQSITGSTVIPSGTWNHVVVTRDVKRVKVFLNGNLEIDGDLPATFADSLDYCLGMRSDKFAPLVGNLAEFAIFERALSDEEATQLHTASGQPRGVRTIGLAMGVREKDKPADCKIHIAGETSKLGPVVPRGMLAAYAKVDVSRESADGESVFSQADFAIDAKQSGRRQLAAWLTHPEHPHTARVMANRVWLHLFGQGIVATPDDFGVYGARPSNPELLDHLAGRLIQGGWSIKQLIRSIVLSRSYQLDSLCDSQLTTADPDNLLVARHNRRRLDAEALRDSMLLASGRLVSSPAQGSLIEKNDSLINWPPGEATDLHRNSNHRSIYLCQLRHAPPPELVAFDLPDSVSVVGARDETTLPTQSLFLLNSRFVVQQSEYLAGSVLARVDEEDSDRVRMIFRRILHRIPSEAETRRAVDFVQTIAATLQNSVTDAERRRLKSWASLCQALFASNEFRYID